MTVLSNHLQNHILCYRQPHHVLIENNRVKMLGLGNCRHLENSKAGAVVDVIDDTEFSSPEMLNFDPIKPGTDMW